MNPPCHVYAVVKVILTVEVSALTVKEPVYDL